jgi:hypothetical protein
VNNFPITATTSAYAALNYSWLTQANGFQTAGVVGANSNSMFNSAFLAPNGATVPEYRLVAAGLSCRYIGTDFRNQGRVMLFREQGNDETPQGVVASDLLQDNYTVAVPVRRKSEYVYYIPDSAPTLSFNTDVTYTGASPIGRAYLIYIDGGDTNTPQSWEYEAVSYFEMIGANLPLTKSDADAPGYSAVLSSLKTKAPLAAPQAEEQGFLNRVLKNLTEGISGVTLQAASVAPAMLANAALRRYATRQTGVPMIEDYD